MGNSQRLTDAKLAGSSLKVKSVSSLLSLRLITNNVSKQLTSQSTSDLVLSDSWNGYGKRLV